jgi:hypothetical protein
MLIFTFIYHPRIIGSKQYKGDFLAGNREGGCIERSRSETGMGVGIEGIQCSRLLHLDVGRHGCIRGC